MSEPRISFVFPGQGSQQVGMGRAWAESSPVAREVFEEADDVLGFSLSALCWQGPADDLQLTENTQPAILAVSVAICRELAVRGLRPVAVAGHSLGEYAALVCAGVLSFADALRLVRQRGVLMQEAVPVGTGAMAAVLGLDAGQVGAVACEAAADQVCTVANYNAPEQTVIAGHREAVERAMAIARERGARRAVLLPVSAPFHCPLMAPARRGLAPLLDLVPFADPTLPVVTNIDARPVTDGAAARDALVRQVDGPVRWVESVRRIGELGVDAIVEVGPGAVLSGLVRRIVPQVPAASVAEPSRLPELEGLLAAAGGG